MRRIQPFTIYPPAELRNKLEAIGLLTERPPSRVAVRLIKQGAERWERRQSKRQQLKA